MIASLPHGGGIYAAGTEMYCGKTEIFVVTILCLKYE
jgi:hypothetical protein